jgi:hypothetical protein
VTRRWTRRVGWPAAAAPPAWSFRDLAAYGMAGRIGSRATGHDVRALGEPLES